MGSDPQMTAIGHWSKNLNDFQYTKKIDGVLQHHGYSAIVLLVLAVVHDGIDTAAICGMTTASDSAL